ncbi:MAG: class I SAM-dependent methyltransferase, partial [Armatimonadota bacterium]
MNTPASSQKGIPERPALELAIRLSEWLSGPRSRALRRAQIGLRRSVLEIGAGHCVVTPELQRRARGPVISTDISPSSSRPESVGVAADGCALPFDDHSFDLVFFQNTLLWVADFETAIAEAVRVLTPGGSLVAIEPDYGGMMEHPDLGLQTMWITGLTAAGADPRMGRKLPAACQEHLQVHVELAHLPRR